MPARDLNRGSVAQRLPLPAVTQHEDILWDLQTLARAERLCDWMFAQIRANGARRVAEIGAGIGTFSDRLLAAGVDDLLLVEPEPACALDLEQRFASNSKVRVARETLPDAASLVERRGEFDLVVCQNVLEHIEDDHAAVRAMADAVRPGGRVFVLVPAHQRLFGSLDRAYGHYRRYGRDRLRALATAAGLEIERLYSFNLLGIPGWWVSSKRESKAINPVALKALRRGASTLAARRATTSPTGRAQPDPRREAIGVSVGLSILMPVYNELDTVERAIEEALAIDLPVDFELIIVDDGSTDGTRALLQGMDLDGSARLILHDRNRGKGAALRTAAAEAQGTYSTVLDADLEYEAQSIGMLLQPLLENDAEVVYGVAASSRIRPTTSGTSSATRPSPSRRTSSTTAGSRTS